MPVAKYKFTYFNSKGRGEMTRLLFAAAGKPFEDERVTQEQWQKLKPNTPQNVLPVLLVDGKTTVVQSQAIARYVARDLGMYGKTNLESTQIDQILETLTDMLSAALPGFREQDATKKAELMTKFMTEDVPKYLGFVDKMIGQFGKDGHAVSNSITLADTAIFSTIEMFQLKDKIDSFKCPRVSAVIKKLEANKNIAKYLKDRPVTER